MVGNSFIYSSIETPKKVHRGPSWEKSAASVCNYMPRPIVMIQTASKNAKTTVTMQTMPSIVLFMFCSPLNKRWKRGL